MGIYASPMYLIGGQGGTSFSDYGTDGAVLEKIGVWAGGSTINAIQVWRTNRPGRTFGDPRGPYKEFIFQTGERITSLSLWGNGAGTRLGWIWFVTNKNRTFDFGMYDWGRKQEYPIPVGSGICVGIFGRSGADIDAGGFAFLDRMRSSELRNVQYPTLNFDTTGISPDELARFSDHNTSTTPRAWKFGGERVRTSSETWSVTAGLEVFSEVSVTAGVPGIAEVGGKFGWKVSATSSWEQSQSEERRLYWESSGVLQPGERISLVALTRQGRLPAIEYTATMEVTMMTGEKFTYPVRDTYKGVAYSSVEVTDSGTGRVLAVGPEPSTVSIDSPTHRRQPMLDEKPTESWVVRPEPSPVETTVHRKVLAVEPDPGIVSVEPPSHRRSQPLTEKPTESWEVKPQAGSAMPPPESGALVTAGASARNGGSPPERQ